MIVQFSVYKKQKTKKELFYDIKETKGSKKKRKKNKINDNIEKSYFV